MPRLPRPRAQRRAVAVLAAGATAFGGMALLGPGTSLASSHREAPYVSSDPAVDNTDVYAFVSPDDKNTATLIANWAPFSEPAGGPNFFPWATDAVYDINIDNNGDAKPDLIYRWTFQDVDNRGTQTRGTANGTFLYNDGPVKTLTDPHLLFRQTYNLDVISGASSSSPVTTRLVAGGNVAPSNVGVASIPDYVALRKAAVTPLGGGAAGKTYAGQAADPFYLDLRIFDLLYGGNLSEVGYNTLKGFDVNTIALQVPKSALAGSGDVGANPVIGVWSTTSRYKSRILKDTNAAPATSTTRSSDAVDSSGGLVQVSRLGNPLVNEAVVPANLKDFFNRSTPDLDSQFLPKVQDPEVPQLIESLYKIPNPNKTPGYEKRKDLVSVFLTGVPGLNATSMNKNNASPSAAEYLRLNLGIDPNPSPNRLGVLAGDNAGFPNGRRLGDDVVDSALQVLEGVLIPGHPAAVNGLGDGVDRSDRPLLSEFPYIADPYTGSDPRQGAQPVTFRQNFTSSHGLVTAFVSNINPPAPGGFVGLYRINRDGTTTGLGNMPLNSAGTGTATKTFPVPSGTSITLNYRVFTARGSVSQTNRGVPTTFTVR